MNIRRNNICKHQRMRKFIPRRRGTAAVEFAVFAPFFVALSLGMIEISHALNASVSMYTALREGGRLAAMDWTDITAGDQTINEKVEQDIRSFLIASGLPGNSNELVVTFTHVDGDVDAGISAGDPFDLADGDNYLKLCRIAATVPYDEVTSMSFLHMTNRTLEASFAFRMGRITGTGT